MIPELTIVQFEKMRKTQEAILLSILLTFAAVHD